MSCFGIWAFLQTEFGDFRRIPGPFFSSGRFQSGQHSCSLGSVKNIKLRLCSWLLLSSDSNVGVCVFPGGVFPPWHSGTLHEPIHHSLPHTYCSHNETLHEPIHCALTYTYCSHNGTLHEPIHCTLPRTPSRHNGTLHAPLHLLLT